MEHNIQDNIDFEQLKQEKAALVCYFSTTECSVCHVLKPKVIDLVKENFPEMDFVYIESNKFPEVAAQNNVFSAPTIVVFFEGKEYIRKSRNIGINELKPEIERIYSKMFC